MEYLLLRCLGQLSCDKPSPISNNKKEGIEVCKPRLRKFLNWKEWASIVLDPVCSLPTPVSFDICVLVLAFHSVVGRIWRGLSSGKLILSKSHRLLLWELTFRLGGNRIVLRRRCGRVLSTTQSRVTLGWMLVRLCFLLLEVHFIQSPFSSFRSSQVGRDQKPAAKLSPSTFLYSTAPASCNAPVANIFLALGAYAAREQTSEGGDGEWGDKGSIPVYVVSSTCAL